MSSHFQRLVFSETATETFSSVAGDKVWSKAMIRTTLNYDEMLRMCKSTLMVAVTLTM